jgi:endo-beta-N-acetylglucosaminidase D
LTLAAGLVLSVMSANAQQMREGYVEAGKNTGSENFHTLIQGWTPGNQVTADDNFYISRVKPRARFRNEATQVRLDLNAKNDKKLIAWIPVNNSDFNALPNGVFDSEVFSMWSYVTHWGNWTSPLGRIPAAFLDVAHKNGVGVSGVASIPNASLSASWAACLKGLASLDVDKTSKFLQYYGIDGLGYNSEFYGGGAYVKGVRTFHAALVKKMLPVNPIFENFWYDGTNDYGQVSFDGGLGNHNKETFGDSKNVRTSLFFNYNWNRGQLAPSVAFAEKLGRDPLDIYCGVNMQGGEPGGTSWSLLPDQRVSIGLWGAHSQNMFWESRSELGSSDEMKQFAYLRRTECYFGGGNRNPVITPSIVDKHQYTAYNPTWHGMAAFMTARSPLSWDLAEEPFITYFNLGNGKFFNLNGERKVNSPWYNVGMQDYLPTWHFWFANKLLGRTAADVPAKGLDAQFVWDDAYFGGSTLKISGTTANEYLHLFKTKYALKKGDVITVRYKLNEGATDLDLVLSAEGSESTGVAYNLCKADRVADVNDWVKQTFTVGSDFDGKTLALVALNFKNAKDLNLMLGEFSIVRGKAATPAAPVIDAANTKMLYNSKAGMDAKIIFNMPNNKAAGEPCYNLDVKTSHFRLYAQEEGKEPMFMGTTTSWAGLYYSIPVEKVNSKVRLGVSAVALDHKTESEIAWSNYMEPATYVYNDDIQSNKKTIKPNEEFTLSYIDPEHPAAKWEIVKDGAVVKSGEGNSWTVKLPETGSYDLKVTGNEYGEDGVAKETTRTFSSYIQITSEGTGALPEIYSLTANGSEEEVSLKVGENVKMAYTGRAADGSGSQGLDLKETRFGVAAADLGLVGKKSFSISFWLKINSLKEGKSATLFNVYNKQDGWPKTDWGWNWSQISPDGSFDGITFRGSDATSNKELQYKYGKTKFPVGNWVHVTMSFDYNTAGQLRADMFLDGVKQTVTEWKRLQGGNPVFGPATYEPTYQSDVYSITNGMYLCIGGPLFDRYGLDGVIDNVVVWDKVATAADVKAAMGDLNANNLPEGVMAFWDFEKKATDNYFTSAGTKAVKGGMQDMVAGGGEGQATLQWIEPTYIAGSPFVSGETYKVETKPSWTAKNATFADITGNGEAGSANVSFRTGGDYDVTLTLSNALGKAEKTFSVIKVAYPTGVDAVEGAEMKAYTVGEDAVVEFAEAGAYEVSVYTTAGEQVARKAAQLNAGNVVNVHLAKAGIYVLNVKKDGKTVRTVKLIRK